MNANMINNVIRVYPAFRQEIVYPLRYTNEVFEKYNEFIKTPDLQNNYLKWKSGINYKTNRKIQIGGKLHTELKRDFMIYYHHYYPDILFETLNDVDFDKYELETKNIYMEIDKQNNDIRDYNYIVRDVIVRIQKLKWDEFIEFEGNKYGVPLICNEVHRENDCFGNIIEKSYDSCSCHSCEDWGGCSNPVSTYNYMCEKCDYTYSIRRELGSKSLISLCF